MNEKAKQFSLVRSTDIRATLAKAIDRHRSLDKIAADKREIAGQAKQLTFEASQHVEALRVAQEAKTSEARTLHARAISAALRAGKPLPPRPGPTATDTVALKVAEEQLAAFEASATELSFEAQEAAQEAACAWEEVAALVDAIFDGEAFALGAELVEATELSWTLLDRLRGLLEIDEARRGGPRLRGLQEDVHLKMNRRMRAVAANGLFHEEYNWIKHLEGLTAAERQKWADYVARLATDHTATFNPGFKQ